MRRAGLLAGAFVLALAGAAAAHTTISGVVKDVNEGARIIVLKDGRVVQLDNQTVILVDNRPVQLAGVTTGKTVVVERGEAVAASPRTAEPWLARILESETIREMQVP
jgi:ferric-dicitrate binding protein FerR (iron transport regulator)